MTAAEVPFHGLDVVDGRCNGGRITAPRPFEEAGPTSKLVDRSPDTRKQHGFDFSDTWRRVPFQAGCASTTMEVDPQQQSATEALNALEHS